MTFVWIVDPPLVQYVLCNKAYASPENDAEHKWDRRQDTACQRLRRQIAGARHNGEHDIAGEGLIRTDRLPNLAVEAWDARHR